MKIKKKVELKPETEHLFFCSLLFAVYCSLFTAIAFAEENPCLSCHPQFKIHAKVVHEPLNMGCETCHEPVKEMSHPQQKGSIKLKNNVPYLCYECHEESKFKKNIAHSPVSRGMCTECHNPHQSEFAGMLVNNPPELCYGCHENKTKKKNPHEPAAKGKCGLCHNAHVSDNTDLLPMPENNLCISCHAKLAKGVHLLAGLGGKHPMRSKPDISRPGKQIGCPSCHEPHGSDFPKLMPQKNLCLRCHKY